MPGLLIYAIQVRMVLSRPSPDIRALSLDLVYLDCSTAYAAMLPQTLAYDLRKTTKYIVFFVLLAVWNRVVCNNLRNFAFQLATIGMSTI